MKRTISLLSLVLALSVSAQEGRTRERIENVTDYADATAVHHARRIGSASSAPLPVTGSPKIPVILVQFDDVKFTSDTLADKTIEHSDANVNQLFNDICNDSNLSGTGLSYGSIKTYFEQQSDGQFSPEFEIIGPVTLSKGYAYYGKDSGSSRDVNISAFYSEACKLAVRDFDVNWSMFDNNLDSRVDFVYFIYAGEAQNAHNNPEKEGYDPDLIWPKESVTNISISDGTRDIVFCGYGCTGELYKGAVDGIGTMCHELSHALGLPDMYDHTNNVAFGQDYLDIMDSGCYQMSSRMPCCYSAYERDFMGWRELELIESGKDTTLILEPIETGGKAYKILNDDQPTGNEYFILENRQNIEFDTYLCCPAPSVYQAYGTGHGLLIHHVDYTTSSWNNNTVNVNTSHQRLTPVPADGQLISCSKGYSQDYFTSIRGDFYPGNANVTEMSSYKVYVGQFTQRISGITENDDKTITVVINNGSATSIASPPTPEGGVCRPDAYYTLSGQAIDKLQKGINIVKMSNGKVKKILVK